MENEQKLKACVGTIFFVLFIGFIRPIILNYRINLHDTVLMAFLFFLWLCYSYAFANTFKLSSINDINLSNL